MGFVFQSQRPENSVMQALESLNDTQVNDFLSGKSPLNLTMRLGDHMMLIQLQLSTLNTASSIAQQLRNSQNKSAARKAESKETPTQTTPQKSTQTASCSDNDTQETVLQQQDIDILQNALGLYQKMTEETYAEQPATNDDKEDINTSNCTLLDLSDISLENEQSPIKSLSNLVSSPIDISNTEGREVSLGTCVGVKNSLIDLLSCNKLASLTTDTGASTSAMADKPCPGGLHTSESSMSDDSDNFIDQSSFLAESTIDEYPMENLFNNAVDKGLFKDQDESMMDREISNLATTSHGTQESSAALPSSFQSLNEPSKSERCKRFQYMLHKTSKFKHPINANKQKSFIQSVVNKQKKKVSNQTEASPQPSTSRTEPYQPLVTSAKKNTQATEVIDTSTPSTSKQLVSFKAPDAPKKPQRVSPTPQIDTKALIEASKNLTQKLKKLSKEVLTNKIDLRAAEETTRAKVGQGAVIETMKHHGKGIYSGTFSGTLNPALQDR